MEIYISKSGQQSGPFSEQQIESMLSSGMLTLADYAWHEGLPEWLQLEQVLNARQPANQSPALPQKYPYNMKWNAILVTFFLFTVFAIILPFLATDTNEEHTLVTLLFGKNGATGIYWVLSLVCALVAILAFFIMIQRCFVSRSLELQDRELILPCGFIRPHLARIPYTTIQRVWEREVQKLTFLNVSTGAKEYVIIAEKFPDRKSYLAVKDFLMTLTK